MTLREISISLRASAKRHKETWALEAALHGLKLNMDDATSAPPAKLTPDQEKLAKSVMEAAIERKRQEIARRTPGA